MIAVNNVSGVSFGRAVSNTNSNGPTPPGASDTRAAPSAIRNNGRKEAKPSVVSGRKTKRTPAAKMVSRAVQPMIAVASGRLGSHKARPRQQNCGQRKTITAALSAAPIVNTAGTSVHAGAGRNIHAMAVTTLQARTKLNATKADNRNAAAMLRPGSIRQRASAPVNNPSPSVWPNAMLIMPDACACLSGMRLFKARCASESYWPTDQKLQIARQSATLH